MPAGPCHQPAIPPRCSPRDAGNKLTLTLTAPGSPPITKQGTFIVEGDVVQATLDQSEPMTLKFVNGGYESTSFGPPMRFVKQ